MTMMFDMKNKYTDEMKHKIHWLSEFEYLSGTIPSGWKKWYTNID